MNKIYNIYQVSDSTGETLDRIFLAIKAQFSDFDCKTIHYSFTRTENQIDKIINKSNEEKNVIILYTIVDKNLAKYLKTECNKNKNDVFVFNGWMFSSSPSLTPFDHPVYDIWLVACN